jgi:hypothetical protein
MGEGAQEDFEWLLREIVEGGGEAFLCETRLIDGLTDEQIRKLFDEARDADYGTVTKDVRALIKSARPNLKPDAINELRAQSVRLRKRIAEIAEIDFFGAIGRQVAEGALEELESRLNKGEDAVKNATVDTKATPMDALRGKTWVTRQGVHVDRIGSAWLIRRFIDPEARFKFVSGKGYRPDEGELRFDMFQAEFTHEGDKCTFEVLLDRAALKDPALRAIAEIIHDIDMRDNKYGRDEAVGIRTLIDGIALTTPDDLERIARGTEVFNNLYEVFGKKRS